MIIGLAGRAGSGKNTAADILCELMPGARQIAFADPLKRIAADLYNLHPNQLIDREWKEQVIPEWGLSPRQILQRLGTEVGRQIHPETWTRYVARQIEARPAVDWIVTDVRMPNEAAMIARLSGETWWVERASAGSRTGGMHSSERALNMKSSCIDRVIDNSGTLLSLRSYVAEVLSDALDCACTR